MAEAALISALTAQTWRCKPSCAKRTSSKHGVVPEKSCCVCVQSFDSPRSPSEATNGRGELSSTVLMCSRPKNESSRSRGSMCRSPRTPRVKAYGSDTSCAMVATAPRPAGAERKRGASPAWSESAATEIASIAQRVSVAIDADRESSGAFFFCAAKNKPITVTDVQSDGRPLALPRDSYRAPHVCAAVAAA
eukprot:scaffold9905_cov117-Isochrysis_galbana.AAC.16